MSDSLDTRRDAAESLSRPPGEHPLLWVLLAAGGGICLDRCCAVAVFWWCAMIAVAVPTFIGLYARGRTSWSAAVLLSCLAALAGLWHHDRWRLFPCDEIARFAQDAPLPVCVRVQVLDAPRWSPAAREGPMSTMTRGEMTRIEVRVLSLRQVASWRHASGYLRMVVEGRYADVYRGDILEVAALLARVRPPLNPGEPDFAALCRGRRQRAILLCEHTGCVQRLSEGATLSPLRQLGRWRLWSERALDRFVGLRRSPLAAALLLGTRERLEQETLDAFFLSGTLHLLAISGLHVGILATAFWLLIRLDWLPRSGVLVATCLLAIGYALLTGARPPVVRATVLIVVSCLARGTGRSAVAWNSWAAAGLVTLLWSPAGLFDTGTQLSFLAVAALLAAWPFVSGRRPPDALDQLLAASRPMWLRGWYRAVGWTGRLLLLSAIVWLVSLPLVAYRFHLVSLVGLVLNVLLWIPVAIALFAALLVLVTAGLPLLPRLCGSVCDTMLSFVQWSTETASQLPAGHFWVAGPPWWWVAIFYLALLAQQLVPRRLPRRWCCALLAGWLIVGVCCGSSATRVWRQRTIAPLRLSFIAVGHGACVLLELPNGQSLLYDAGRMGSPRAAALPISSVLWSRGIRHLDTIVLSHADADHFNAVPVLLNRFSVGIIYVSPVMFHNPAPALAALRDAIQASGVPVGILQEGDHLRVGKEVAVEVLHPPSAAGYSGDAGDNAQSVVLQLACGPYRVLLTGDLEGAGMDELLAEMPPRCDLLLAPHHGSRHSRPAQWVRWAHPSRVVISAGAGLAFDQAAADYASQGALVYWTHRDGLVEVVIDGRQLVVTNYFQDGSADKRRR